MRQNETTQGVSPVVKKALIYSGLAAVDTTPVSRTRCHLDFLRRECGRRFRNPFGLSLSVLLCLLILGGCQSVMSLREEGKVGAEVFVQENLVGEECRVQNAHDPEYANQVKRQFEVFCGRWEHPSGHLYEVSSKGRSLNHWIEGEWWWQALEQRAACGAGEAGTVLDGVEALVLQCQLHNGGWPYTALVTSVGGTTYFAEGIPAVLPVLEGSVGVVSGRVEARATKQQSSRSALARRIEADLSGRIYGAGDLQTYYRLMTAGQFYNSVNDFATAASRYREALAVHERVLGMDNSQTLDAIMHLALELSNQRRFVEAQALFDRADGLAKQAVDQGDHARYLSYRAVHAANQSRFSEALQFARDATAMRRELLAGSAVLAVSGIGEGGQGIAVSRRADVAVLGNMESPTTVDLVQSLYIEASMLERLGEIEQAQKVLNEAGGILQSADEAPPSWEPQLLALSGRIAASRGAAKEREKRLNQAANLWEEIAPGERPGGIAYLALGEVYRDQGRPDDAMVAFRKGIKLIESRNGNLAFNQLLPFMQTSFELAQADPEKRDRIYIEMFEAGQLVRGGQTAQDIARAAARLAASEGPAGEVVRELQDAEDRRHFLYRDYEMEVAQSTMQDNDEKLAALRDQIAEVNKTIQELGAQVQAAFPGYNQLVDSVVKPTDVIKLVGPNEALAQVLLGDPESILFLVRNGKVRAYRLPVSEYEVASSVEKLRSGLEPNRDGSLPKFDVSLAHQLYGQLLGPVSSEIEGVEHLITVPTGPLLSLPFGLLVTEPPAAIKGYDYTRVEWLAKRSAISLLPSVRSFVDLRAVAKGSQAANAFIGFGNFVPFTEESVTEIKANMPRECLADPARLETHRQLLLRLGALPVTEAEITSISRTFPADLTAGVFGTEFSEPSVSKGTLRDYRVIYFATHGILPAELGCQPEPSLVASLSENPGEGEDGLVDTSEILKLRLDADLVVLSACNTGGPGTETGGESLSGLARAFFFAGARSLIVSHWLAENKTTAQLMIRMFNRMREAPDTGLAEALRAAQLSIVQDAMGSKRRVRSHPLLWAAFSVVGDGAKSVSGV